MTDNPAPGTRRIVLDVPEELAEPLVADLRYQARRRFMRAYSDKSSKAWASLVKQLEDQSR